MMRELVELSWPIATAMLGETALGLVDTKLVGSLGPAALAGVGLGWTLLMLLQAVIFGMMRGVKVRAAYAIGQGRPDDAIRYGQAGLLIGAAAAVLVMLAARDVSPVLRWLGVDAATVAPASEYLAARSLGAVGTCAAAALVQYRQGIGDSRTPMLIGLGGNVVNAVLAWSLIHGRLGLPALGVRGAGYGTAITELLELAVLVALLLCEERRPSISLRLALRETLALGLPTGLHFGLEALAFTTFTTLLGSIGAAELAAHQIALVTIRASFLPGVAVAEAASVLVARSLGRRRIDEADRATAASLWLGVGFMTACGLVFALFGAAIAGAFAEDAEVVVIARRLLLVAAVFQALDAANVILRGALRGAKDVRWVAVVGTTAAWVCVPGSALVLGRLLGWGAVGGWLGFVLETAVASLLLWRRWSRGPWRAQYGAPPAEGDEDQELAPASA